MPLYVRRLFPLLWTVVFLGVTPHTAQSQTVDPPASCAHGRIDRIQIRNGNVFSPDVDDPGVLRWAYRTANHLHIPTRPAFIKKSLLFRVGDCLEPYLLTESELLLSGFPFLRSVRITHEQDGTGGETVHVDTRDEWTTQVNLGVNYDAGLNFKSFALNEFDFLGEGIRLSASKHQYREDRSQSISVAWPYLVRHTNIRTAYASSPSGFSYDIRVAHPFVGDVGSHSFRVDVGRSSSFFSYGTPSGSQYAHVLLPLLHESTSIQYGRRFGTRRDGWVTGLILERQVLRVQGAPEYVEGNNFDHRQTSGQVLPGSILRQIGGQGATRLSLLVGARKNVPTQMVGLDAVRDVQFVANGYQVAFSLGQSLGLLVPDSLAAHDTFAHVDAAMARPIGPSYFRAGLYSEADHQQGGWEDVLAGADVVAYGRADWLPAQTLFFRASGAGGWRTTVPFQLTLGGPEGIRSLADEEVPGGRRLVLTFEDRIRLDWPTWQAVDLGLTVFGDAGKMWAGDAPLGVTSPWEGSFGFGLRIGAPRGTRIIWRPDIAFPVGRPGAPIFRITLELNSLRSGFQTAKLLRSMRFNQGVQTF